MANQQMSTENLKHTDSKEVLGTSATSSSLHTARIFIAIYAGLSILSVVLVAITGGNTETWVHTIIITIMAILLFRFAHNMTKGNEKALLRVCIVLAILIPALLVTLIVLKVPLWLRIEHALAIVVLIPVAWIVFRKR